MYSTSVIVANGAVFGIGFPASSIGSTTVSTKKKILFKSTRGTFTEVLPFLWHQSIFLTSPLEDPTGKILAQ